METACATSGPAAGPELVPLLEAWLYLHRGSAQIDLARFGLQ